FSIESSQACVANERVPTDMRWWSERIERAIQYFHAISEYLTPSARVRVRPSSRSRRARARRRQGPRGVTQRLLLKCHRREDSPGPVPVPGGGRQVPDRLRRAAATNDVRRQSALGRQ